ncbi:MAG: hypothetical protein HZB19_11100 [Chloroflexi bacterium]|nr:hypothetical protein [Chloroflexota bacterium]
MAEEKTYTLSQAQLHFAIDFNNQAWELLEKPDRTSDENFRMLDFAHASLAHWRSAGTAARHQRGEWLLARVHTVLKNLDQALLHAKRCEELLEANKAEMSDFDYAFTYEALSRAHAMRGDRFEAKKFIELAKKAGEAIKDAEDREIFFREFDGGEWNGMK